MPCFLHISDPQAVVNMIFDVRRELFAEDKTGVVDAIRELIDTHDEVRDGLETLLDKESIDRASRDIQDAVRDIVSGYDEALFDEGTGSVFYTPDDKELSSKGVNAEKKVDIYGNEVQRDIIAEYNAEKDELTYHVFYGPPQDGYHEKRNEEMRDTSNLVPFKSLIVDKFPGLYGWTILTDNVMGLDEGLQKGDPEFKKMVYVHEAIHTPDEFETRMITDWIMSKEMPMSYQLMGKDKFM